MICGGLSKNPIFIQTHSEACDLPVLCPNEKETVLVGAAILGACAAKFYPNLEVCYSMHIHSVFFFKFSFTDGITRYGWQRNRCSTRFTKQNIPRTKVQSVSEDAGTSTSLREYYEWKRNLNPYPCLSMVRIKHSDGFVVVGK